MDGIGGAAGAEPPVVLFSGPCDAGSPAEVRRSLAALTPRPVPPRLIPDCQLIASELISNALNAGADWIDALLLVAGEHLELSVHDEAPGLPMPQDPPPTSLAGRGLAIVEAISAAWGFWADPDDGKTVWARLNLPASPEMGA